MSAKQKIDVVKSSYEVLVKTLPIKEILVALYQRKVLTTIELAEIRDLDSSLRKNMYLLDNVILRSLRVGYEGHFEALVNVLSESENKTAQNLGKQLKEGKVESTVESVKYGGETDEDAAIAKAAIRSMFTELLELPIDSLMPALKAKPSVVGTTDQETMDKMTRTQKTAYLLNEIVIPSLRAKSFETFNNFLKILKESESHTARSLGADLSEKLGHGEVSLPKIIPPNDEAGMERFLSGSLPEGISAYSAMEHWIYAICWIRYETLINDENTQVDATGFVGTLTLKGINEGKRMLVLVTNNHVFQKVEQARSATYQFGYLSNNEFWQPKEIKGEKLIPKIPLFFTHKKTTSHYKWLDYTVVSVYENPLRELKFVSKLDGVEHSVYDCMFNLDKHVKPSTEITDNEIVSVYHHPRAKVMQKSTQRSISCEYLLYYQCDTDGGSSGAPLVKTTRDGHRNVYALHRGFDKLNGNSYNYGTLMSTIIKHIRDKTEPEYFRGEEDIVSRIDKAGIPI